MIGVAHAKRECWALGGFEPKTDAEAALLTALRRALGFDPITDAAQLDAKEEGAKRNAKRVLAKLTGGDRDRELDCWTLTSLPNLESRGVATGLKDYIAELRRFMIPLYRRERA